MMIEIFIFSFNRGAYLANAVRSALENVPGAKVTVVDDNSDDISTLTVLARLKQNVEVITPDVGRWGRLGGLYRNMQIALDAANPRCFGIFMQDDMQIVRKMRPEDEEYIEKYFSFYPSAGFLYPVFLKGALNPSSFKVSDGFECYEWRGEEANVGHYYSDVFICDVGRLLQRDWRFEEDERRNADRASRHFSTMGIMRDPLLMYVPEVPIFRGRGKTFAARMIAGAGESNVNYFVSMSEVREREFLQRSVGVLPIAETFLATGRPTKAWPYVYSNIEAQHTIVQKMHYWEIRAKKAFAKMWSAR